MPSCPHRPPCPGCPRFLQPGLPPETRKRLGPLIERAGLPMPEPRTGPSFGWRQRARLAVRGRARSPKFGLFEAGSHRIVDTPNCPIHHPLINEVARALRQALRTTGTRPYHEASHQGLVRYVQIVVERPSTRAQIVLVCNDDSPEAIEPLAARLHEELGAKLHSLFWNGNTTRHNVILGPDWKRLLGPEAVCEHIADVDVFFPPGAFGQANLGMADQIVEHVASGLIRAERVADVYSGCGAFGLPLLARGAEVRFCERSEYALAGLQTGIDARPQSERARSQIHAGDLSDPDELDAVLAGCDAVILDPPRRGARPALIEYLAKRPPARLVYVSCGLQAFVQQTEALLAPGQLELMSLDAYALFPHTEHIEVVAQFARRARAA